MKEAPRCDKCRWWFNNRSRNLRPDGAGSCTFVKPPTITPEATAYVLDSDGNDGADFWTKPDFGCVAFKEGSFGA